MNAGAWIMLVSIGTGILGGLAYFAFCVPKTARISLPSRPIWMVLLDGGVNGRDRSDDPDNGPGRMPPRIPPQDRHKSVGTSDTGGTRSDIGGTRTPVPTEKRDTYAGFRESSERPRRTERWRTGEVE